MELSKEHRKFMKRIFHHVNLLNILANKKRFPKTISQYQFDYSLFAKLLRINFANDFPPSSFKLKRGVLPPLTK